MLIASMIVKVSPEHALEVKSSLDRLTGVTTYGIHKENNIIAVVEIEGIDELEKLSKRILADHEGVLAVLPTFLGAEQEDTEG